MQYMYALLYLPSLFHAHAPVIMQANSIITTLMSCAVALLFLMMFALRSA